MTMFWIVAALFLIGALLMVLPALLRPTAQGASAAGLNLAVHRDQWREIDAELAAGVLGPDRAEQARADIQQRMLEDTRAAAGSMPAVLSRSAPRTAWALAAFIPLASVLVYLALGQPAFTGSATAPKVAAADRHKLSAEEIQAMAAALAERLKSQPQDAQGWQTLARSYVALGRYRDAATAFQRAVEQQPQDANLLADAADVSAMAQGKRLTGEPARLIQRALDLDPRHPKALALAGSVAFEARDYSTARGYWQRLLELLPPGSPMVRSIQGSLAQAEAMAAQTGTLTAPASSGAATVASAAASLSGEVVLNADLAARVSPGDTLFVYARAVEGPRIPLAVQRAPAVGTVMPFKLDDSMAMAPNLRLSGFSQVKVSARISRSGGATPQPGDLVGESGPLAPGAHGLRITIDRVQP